VKLYSTGEIIRGPVQNLIFPTQDDAISNVFKKVSNGSEEFDEQTLKETIGENLRKDIFTQILQQNSTITFNNFQFFAHGAISRSKIINITTGDLEIVIWNFLVINKSKECMDILKRYTQKSK
jgi:hypothetical protein